MKESMPLHRTMIAILLVSSAALRASEADVLRVGVFKELAARPGAEFSVVQYGFYSDPEKLVWAWKVEGLRKYVERDGRMNI